MALVEARGNLPKAAREVLLYARDHTRLWKSLLHGVDPWREPWENLPVMDRLLVGSRFADTVADERLKDVEAVLAHFRNAPGKALFDQYQVFTSAGRDGILTTFIYDGSTWGKYVESWLERLNYAGLDAGRTARVAFVGTDDPAHTQTRLAREFRKFPRFSVGIFGLQQGLGKCLEGLERFAPDIVCGFSSAVGMVAGEQVAGRLSIEPERVFVGTDTLSASDRSLVWEAWRKTPFDCYGSTEGGLIGIECTEHEGLHLNEKHVWVEFEEGRMLITNLLNRAQPIIRYRMPDGIEVVDVPCACGRESPRLIPTEGRLNRILELPGQNEAVSKVHPIVIRSALDTAPCLLASEATHEGSSLKVKVWGTGGVSIPEVRSRLVDALTVCEVDLGRTAVEITLEEIS